MLDLHNHVEVKRLISPVNVTDNTAQVSQIIDTANYGSVELVFAWGSLADADATFTVLVEDGDNSALTDNAAVADADLLGTELGCAPLFSDDNKVSKIGYKGSKRYVRATVTPAANTGNAYMAGIAILSDPRVAPLTTQLQA